MATDMREWTLDLPTGRIAGLRCGEPGAPRVLALHGWLDNAASFVPLAAHLPGLDLVCPDFPGHGRSAHLAPGADYSFAAAVHGVLDIADALGWERFALLGHSMGAGIGSLVAAGCPGRIERFVAIEALGALAEVPERTVERLRDAVAATRALPDKRLRIFPDIATAVRARMQANGLSEAVARLLVERGLAPVECGFAWSSDPRLPDARGVRRSGAALPARSLAPGTRGAVAARRLARPARQPSPAHGRSGRRRRRHRRFLQSVALTSERRLALSCRPSARK
jgi:pimeloyl-ACP methyl ester carboxylesterase